MPHERKHATSAARQQAYRDRLAAKRPALEPPTTADPKAWDAYLRKVGLGMSRGNALTDAPREKRLLLTGVVNRRVL